MAIFYSLAGLNHFVHPGFYEPLIPPYFPWPQAINYGAGFLELLAGLGLCFKPLRRVAAYAIIGLLVLFIPSHLYFISLNSCVEDGLCVPPWLAWLRLLLIHPLLCYWAYTVSKK